jgi:hemolysin D
MKSVSTIKDGVAKVRTVFSASGPGAIKAVTDDAVKTMRGVLAFPQPAKGRGTDEMQFLPAALEIVETPPSPIGRAIAVSLMAIFCLALLWAVFGRIDIVASAPGKIIPSGRTKILQPYETGVIRAINVRDGQSVKAGDVLIELDPTMNQAERSHIQSDLTAAHLEVARLRAALADSDDPLSHFVAPAGASAAQIATQRRYLVDQTAERRAKLATIDSQRRQKEAERATTAATIEKLESVIPLIKQRVAIREELFNKELGSKIIYLENLQSLVDSQKEVEVQRNRLREAEAAIAALTESRAQTEAEYRSSLYADLVEAERKAAGFAHDLERVSERTRLQVLTAPVDGVVQQLAVHTVGGVVTPAQALLVVVPSDSRLEIEANVSNRDIGFVHAGQEVEIKVDTFNFTRYGLLHGKVLSVSHDSIVRENPQNKPSDKTQGTEVSSSEPAGQQLVYHARISLDRAQMQIDDNLVNLSPGMAVTAEIKTGSRRVITYLLSPLVRYGHESMRER